MVSPAPVCFIKPGPFPEDPIDINSVTRRPGTTTTAGPYASMSYEDFMMASVVNRTWTINQYYLRQCSLSTPCRDNEQCLMPALCGRGVCACVPPNVQDENYNCWPPSSTTSTTTPVPSSTTTRTTTTSTTTTSTTSTTTTTTSTSTTTTTSTSTSTTTTTKPPKAYYAMPCDVDKNNTDCGRVGIEVRPNYEIIDGLVENHLICKTNGSLRTYCLCQNEQYFWDTTIQTCKLSKYDNFSIF